MDDWVIV
jgi:hypothetical protein